MFYDVKHFSVKTLAGVEDIYCDALDDTHPAELWFTSSENPVIKLQRFNVLSIQEQPCDAEEARFGRWEAAERVRKFQQGRNLTPDL